MKLTLLGTGTPTPSLKRASSSYLLEIGNDLLLLDHGPGAHWRLLQSGKEAADVTHIFFSHLHYDHCLDYTRLLIQRWDQVGGIAPELKVFGPPDTKRMHDLLFSKDGAFAPDISARTNSPGSLKFYEARGGVLPRPWPNPDVLELQEHQVVEGNNWKLTVRSVPHAQPELVCYAYRIDTEEGSIVYSGDTGLCKAIPELSRDADVLIHMCHCISGTHFYDGHNRRISGHLELAQMAADANVKTCVLTHITEQIDVPGVRERLICEIRQIYDGNIIWGEDLMEVPISNPKPKKLS